MTRHPEFDTLDDLAAGALAGADRVSAEQHVADCSECRAQVARIRDLLARTRELPRDIEPPAELWSDVRIALGRRERAVVAARASRHWWNRSTVWMLAAAALVLVASS